MADDLLPTSVLRQIGHNQYDKRKIAALEVEQTVKRLAKSHDFARVQKLVDKLIAEYAFSPQANHRKGALLCLAAATVGLGSPTEAHLRQLVPPVLASFTDQDGRVRYYACEALYNIAKVAREPFTIFFNEVFDAMFRLCADAEANVLNAVQFLDNLVKDIIAASPASFNMAGFVPKLRDYLRVAHPNKRMFLVSWITVLDSVPDLDLLVYLPQLLDGLMAMLSDPNREIRVAAHKAMMEFLIEIHATQNVDFASMAVCLVDKATSPDEFTRMTAIKWLKEFVEMAAVQLVGQYPAILGVVLANISHPSREIVEVSRQANDALLNLAPANPNQESLQLDTGAILATISAELLRGTLTPGSTDADPQVAVAMAVQTEPSRLEALRWVHFLLDRAQTKVLVQLPALLPALLDALLAHSETVVEAGLGVFAAIASCPGQFRPMLGELLGRFRGDTGALLLQRGGALVIRRLCGFMGSEAVFTELAGALQEEPDLVFAATMVQALNLILLTSPEVRGLRETLRGAAAPPLALPTPSGRVYESEAGGAQPGRELQQQQQQGAALFAALYRCWAHSSGALLSLCLLAQAYDHAYEVIQCYRWLPMGTEVLVQMDRLVQLLDTPTFTFLRLQLLQPRQHAALLRALYALLQLLPQSNAFRLLSMRLQAMPWHTLMQMDGLEPFPSLAAAADAHAASAPSWAAPHKPMPSAGAEPQAEQTAPVRWVDLDLPALLRDFCAKQQRHYLVEIGLEEAAALAAEEEAAAGLEQPGVVVGPNGSSSTTAAAAAALAAAGGDGAVGSGAPQGVPFGGMAGEGQAAVAATGPLQQHAPVFSGDSFSSEAFFASGRSTTAEAGGGPGGSLEQGPGSAGEDLQDAWPEAPNVCCITAYCPCCIVAPVKRVGLLDAEGGAQRATEGPPVAQALPHTRPLRIPRNLVSHRCDNKRVGEPAAVKIQDTACQLTEKIVECAYHARLGAAGAGSEVHCGRPLPLGSRGGGEGGRRHHFAMGFHQPARASSDSLWASTYSPGPSGGFSRPPCCTLGACAQSPHRLQLQSTTHLFSSADQRTYRLAQLEGYKRKANAACMSVLHETHAASPSQHGHLRVHQPVRQQRWCW